MTAIACWLMDWLFAGVLILAIGAVATAMCRAIALRERIAELSLAAAVLAAVPTAIPNAHKFSLGLLSVPAESAGGLHIGLLPWNSGKLSPVQQPEAHPAGQAGSAKYSSSVLSQVAADWELWLPLAYAAGVAFMLSRLMTGAWLLRKIRKNARPISLRLPKVVELQCRRAGADVYISQVVVSPLAAGWFTPVILLPEGFESRREAAGAVMHELAHITRRDVRWRYLISFANAILFINPLAYYLAGQARLAQEILADHHAADYGPSPAAYADILLSLIKSRQSRTSVAWPTTFLLGGKSEMLRRLEHIAAGKPVGPPSLGRPLLLGLLATATLASAAASAITLQHPQVGGACQQVVLPGTSSSPWRAAEQMRNSALHYLTQRQQPNGAWLGRYGPAVTALVVRAFLLAGASPDLPPVSRGLHFIESCHQPDGGYYRLDEPAYNTAIVVRTLSMLSGQMYRRRCARAMAFLKSIDTPTSADDGVVSRWYAGQNTSGGVAIDHVAHYGARVTALTADFGNLDPHERPGNMRLRSYGSITYSQLKSMIYASLSPRDPRVAMLSHWLRAEKRIQNDPAAHGARGLFYFCLVYARVMHAMENAPSGPVVHLWRTRLVTLMQKLRRPGGYWENTYSTQWLEGNRIMATTYAALIFENILAH